MNITKNKSLFRANFKLQVDIDSEPTDQECKNVLDSISKLKVVAEKLEVTINVLEKDLELFSKVFKDVIKIKEVQVKIKG